MRSVFIMSCSSYQLKYPAIDVFPLFTLIPFTLKITTESKPMKHEDTPEDKPIFPAPPTRPRDVTFELRREVRIAAKHWTATSGDTVTSVGGMGTSFTPCEADVAEKVWKPVGDGQGPSDSKGPVGGKGTWLQETMFRSTILLKCPPSFDFETIGVEVRNEWEFSR